MKLFYCRSRDFEIYDISLLKLKMNFWMIDELFNLRTYKAVDCERSLGKEIFYDKDNIIIY